MVIPLRRQGKVMLVQRIGYEPATEANFAGLVAGMTLIETPRQDENGKIVMGYGIKNVTIGEVLMRRQWEQTVIVWFSGQSIIKASKLQG